MPFPLVEIEFLDIPNNIFLYMLGMINNNCNYVTEDFLTVTSNYDKSSLQLQ